MHWTYRQIEKVSDDLEQGDILDVTDELREILDKYHPYYSTNDKNKYYIILTQTCDLVRRNGIKCKTSYITIAPVRLLSNLLIQEMPSKIEDSPIPVCEEEEKNKFTEKLRKIINNNASDYFYLHEEQSSKFPDSAFVMLRLPISFRAEHYIKFQNARILGLDNQFKDKLGWLVGQIYSRVGTRDWEYGQEKSFLENETNKIIWIKKHQLKELGSAIDKWKQDNLGQYFDSDALNNIISKLDTRKPKEKFVSHLKHILPNNKTIKKAIANGSINENGIDEIISYIQQDPQISSYIKQN